MKTTTLALLLVSSFSMSSTPARAFYEEVVEFRYKADELKSAEGRVALLKRMSAKARSACRDSASFFTLSSDDTCQADIEKQLLSAIGDSTLLALYEGDVVKIAQNDL